MRSLRAVWRCRTLAAVLTGRELKTRYRGSTLGFLWTLANPLFLMLVYTLVFSVFMRSAQEHYAVFVFAGLLPWLWFTSSLSLGAVSVVRDGHLLKKVSFPSEILPFTVVAAGGVNFLLSLPLYLLFAILFGVGLGWPLLLLPLVALLQFVLIYGLALLLSALNVYYRDVEHLVGNLLTLLFFLTPILYAEGTVPERYRPLLALNPAAAMTGSYRAILFDAAWPRPDHLAGLAAWAVAVLLLGEGVFRSLSPGFAEKV